MRVIKLKNIPMEIGIRTKKLIIVELCKGVYAYKITNNNKEVDTTINKEDGFNWVVR